MIINLADGIENLITGLGGFKDASSATTFAEVLLNQDDMETAYRYDWIFPKAVDIPAKDATRKFLSLSGKIAKIYKQLRVKYIVRKALEYKALYGISYIVVESEKRLLKTPLREGETVKKLHVYHNFNFDSDDKEVHDSRVYEMRQNEFGDSILYKIQESVLNLLTALEIPASLLHKADMDFLSIKGLASALAKCKKDKDCKEAEEKILKRVQTMYEQMSMFKIGIKDTEEQFENFSKNMGGYDKLQQMYMYIVSGAVDIPVTRFFGMNPSGMNATGQIEMDMYYDSLSSMQDELIEPFLEKINGVMGFDEPIEFLPIRDKTKKEKLEDEEIEANIIQKFADYIDGESLAEALSRLSVFKDIELKIDEQEEI
jgi:hypothetical protein